MLFDSLFPQGIAGRDVLEGIASDGWEPAPLLACFHPSVECVFEEWLLMHRNLEQLRRVWKERDGASSEVSYPEPTLDGVRREYSPSRCVRMRKSPSWWGPVCGTSSRTTNR